MKKRSDELLSFLANGMYFVVIFAIALGISTVALARRMNSYQATNAPFVLQVQKEEIALANTISGKIVAIKVKPGQHVKKGELLAQLSDQATESKISTLEKFAEENISAKTEAEALKTLTPQFEIFAPKDGIVYKVHVVEDTYLPNNTSVITLFSDENTKLVGIVSPEQYLDLLKQKKLDVFSSRREQVFGIRMEAVSRVIPATQYEPSRYELYFQFVNPEDAVSFIQGENVDVVAKTRDEAEFRPINMITSFWNSLVTGK